MFPPALVFRHFSQMCYFPIKTSNPSPHLPCVMILVVIILAVLAAHPSILK